MAAVLDERVYNSDVVVHDNGATVAYTKDLEMFAKNKHIDYMNRWYFKGFILY